MRWPFAAVLLLVGATLIAGDGQSARAHAALAGSAPAANEFLRTAPQEIRLDFSEPVDLSASGIRLLDGGGQELKLGAVTTVRGGATMLAEVPGLGPGIYNVLWSNVSKVDGHGLRGSFPFTVLNPDGSLPEGENLVTGLGSARDPAPLADGIAVRFLTLLGLAVIAGSVLLALLWRPVPLAVQRGLTLAMLAGVALLAAGTLLELRVLADTYAGYSLPDIVRNTRAGRFWFARIASVIFVLFGVASDTPPRRLGSVCALLGLASYALSYSATSHGAAGVGSRWAGAIDYVHIVAAATWIGAVIAIAISGRLAGRSEGYRTLLPRFSLLASVSVFALLGSGVFNSLIELSSPKQLVDTRYGVTLLVKLALLLPLLGVAAYNATTGRRRLVAQHVGEPRRFVRSATIEAALGLAVFVPAAMLSQTGVAKSVPYEAEVPKFEQTRLAAGLERKPGELPRVTSLVDVGLVIEPYRTGLNTFRVTVGDGSGAPPAIERVRLVFRYQEDQNVGPSELSLTPAQTPGQYIGQGPFLNQDGKWSVEVQVRRPQLDDVITFFDVRPAGAAVARLPRGGKWANPATGLSANQFAGLVVLFFAFGGFIWRRRVARFGAPASWATQAFAVAGFAVGVLLLLGTHRDPAPGGLPRNPIFPDQNSISAGRALYLQNCATCHGDAGVPPRGLDLKPYPLDLTIHAPQHADGRLFLYTAQGLPGTAMRAWSQGQGKLSDEQIWHIVNFLRTLGTVDQ